LPKDKSSLAKKFITVVIRQTI